MIHKKINLTDDGCVFMTTYIHERSERKWHPIGEWQPDLRPVIIILPGGAYRYCSDREAEPVVLPFFAAGFNAFILNYSLGEECIFPVPLEDISKAIYEVRKNAREWFIDPDKIAVGGFSAGAALTTMIGTQWNTKGLAERLGIPEGENKPNALLVGYGLTCMDDPSINMPKPYVEVGAIVKQNPDELNTYQYVGEHTPPAFIWHTTEDELVSYKHALKFVESLDKYNIPFELHIFEKGYHGLSISTDLTAYGYDHPINVEQWVPMCIKWMRNLFKF
jgi:Esterase/lipase